MRKAPVIADKHKTRRIALLDRLAVDPRADRTWFWTILKVKIYTFLSLNKQ